MSATTTRRGMLRRMLLGAMAVPSAVSAAPVVVAQDAPTACGRSTWTGLGMRYCTHAAGHRGGHNHEGIE